MKLQRYTAEDAHRIEEIWAANMKPPKPEAPDPKLQHLFTGRVLRTIMRGYQTSHEIAAHLRCKKSYVQVNISNLVKNRLIESTGTQKGARSRNINIYQLTAAGRAHLETDE